MPFPSPESIRKAVELAICEGLDHDEGDWTAQHEDGEFQFRPGGGFSVGLCLDDEEFAAAHEKAQTEEVVVETNYNFRIRVEFVGQEPTTVWKPKP